MQKTNTQLNAETLAKEFDWFHTTLETRMKIYFEQECDYKSIFDLPMPDLSEDKSAYAHIIRQFNMSAPERLILLLALAPHFEPQLLDLFFTKNALYDRVFTEFGGLIGKKHRGFLPTGETAMFLLAGTDLYARFSYAQLLDQDTFFVKYNLISLSTDTEKEPPLSGALTVSEEFLTYFSTGNSYRPVFSTRFPAEILTTKLDWSDLVLDGAVLEQVKDIHTWIEHEQAILGNKKLIKRIKRGYRALFYGPPGTGKSLTATLLGKSTGRPVYRVDISQLVSKYIGETEKNLANIFNQAENKNWILFFDEAEALFGSRSEGKDAQDRYANQEIAYLLQRIENHPSIILLATNLKGNIDVAFARRFQSMIYFPIPAPRQRLKLWQDAFGDEFVFDETVDLVAIAKEYEIAGGAISNVLRHCTLIALAKIQEKEEQEDVKEADKNDIKVIGQDDIIEGIRREFRKEGRVV